MSNEFIWGLTYREFEKAGWNSVNMGIAFFGCVATAAMANGLAQLIIPDYKNNKPSGMKKFVCTFVGIGAGVFVGLRYVDRLQWVTFAADKAFKFLVLSCLTGIAGCLCGPLGSVFKRLTIV